MAYDIALSTVLIAYVTKNKKQKMKTTKQSKTKPRYVAKSKKEDTDRDTKRGKQEKRKEGKTF